MLARYSAIKASYQLDLTFFGSYEKAYKLLLMCLALLTNGF